jgi:hypothetical protein
MRNLYPIKLENEKLLDITGKNVTNKFPKSILFFVFASLWVAYFVQTILIAFNVTNFLLLFFFISSPFLLVITYLTIIDCPISMLFVKYPSSQVFSKISGWGPMNFQSSKSNLKHEHYNSITHKLKNDSIYSNAPGNVFYRSKN